MDDSDKGDGPGSNATPPPKPIGGLVIDPRDVKTNPSLMKFLRERLSAALVSGLTTIGILRPRTVDGELGPRHWKGLFAFLGTIFAILFVWTSIHVVQPGNVAVPVTFGHAGKPLGPGVHITLPFTRTYSMSTRTQNYTMSSTASGGPKGSIDSAVVVLGSDGGAGTVNATLLYRLDRSQATNVYRNLGRGYGTAVVRPTAQGCIRLEFTKYGIQVAASTASGTVESDIATCIKNKLDSAGVLMQSFQLRGVALSKSVQTAVDLKVAAQQKLQQQLFDEATAEKQADIVRIQALATNDQALIAECGGHPGTTTVDGQTVQTILPNPADQCTKSALTPEFLQFSYIQALQSLATSGNASTVVLPFDKNLTPIFSLPAGSSSSSSSSTTSP